VSDVQNTAVKTPVEIEQDANLFVAELDRGKSLPFIMHDSRMAYILCVEGAVKVSCGPNEVKMDRHDGCEVSRVTSTLDCGKELVFSAGIEESSHVLVFEMEHVPGAGRKDI
jgi:redox-sensitive bicupin YhaK (pirin superfamily)